MSNAADHKFPAEFDGQGLRPSRFPAYSQLHPSRLRQRPPARFCQYIREKSYESDGRPACIWESPAS